MTTLTTTSTVDGSITAEAAGSAVPSIVTRPIRFLHAGRIVEVHDAPATRTVLEWLREDARCTGTKEGCNEGDCGACTIVVAERLPGSANDTAAAGPEFQSGAGADVVRDGVALRTMNACIQFLPTLDGRALFTVEDLKVIAGGRLHPVQQAMVECHGSQCGFCTPGFVMSLWTAYERAHATGRPPTRQQLADHLAGNLCRCTGYRPILDAGQRMFDLPAAPLDTRLLATRLAGLGQDDRTFRHSGGQSPGRLAPDRTEPGTAPSVAESTGVLAPSAEAPATHASDWYAPTTIEALAALRESRPDATLIAGATDIGLWVNKQFRPLGDLIQIGRVEALRRIELRDEAIRIGAAVSLEAAWGCLAGRLPTLTDVWRRFASPPIRHAGTMAGNVANGSPIGDGPPILMALDASLDLRRGMTTRRLALDAFYVDYMKNQLAPGEFIEAIVVPLAATARTVRAYKISKRFDSDISALCAGLAIELDGGIVRSVRLAFGGMAAVVKRAAAAEAALLGRPWDAAAVTDAQAALAGDFTPLTDLRASAAYRLRVARNLLQRFWLETRPVDPLPASALNAYHSMTEEAHAR